MQGFGLDRVRLVELGGGDGRLSHYLQLQLSAYGHEHDRHPSDQGRPAHVDVICTDSGASNLHSHALAR